MSDNTYPEANVEAILTSDSKAGALGTKIKEVFEEAAEVAKKNCRSLSDGPTGITADFGKPLIFDSAQPQQDISNIPGLGKPVLDFSEDVPRVERHRPADTPKAKEPAEPAEPQQDLSDIPGLGKPVLDFSEDVPRLERHKPADTPKPQELAKVGGAVDDAQPAEGQPEVPHVERDIVYPDGSKTTIGYDQQGHLRSIADKAGTWKRQGDDTWVHYDKSNKKDQELDGLVSVSDEGDILFMEKTGYAEIQHADGSSTQINTDKSQTSWDAHNKPVSMTDVNGVTSVVKYGSDGKPEQIISSEFVMSKEKDGWVVYRNGGPAKGEQQADVFVTDEGDIVTLANDGSMQVRQLNGKVETIAAPAEAKPGSNFGTEPVKAVTSADLERLFEKNKDRLDTDHDGFVSEKEIDAAMEDASFKGEDAQLVAVLKDQREKLQGLSDDEIGPESHGVTTEDIRQFAARRELGEEKELVAKVDFTLSRSGKSLQRANTSLWGNSSDPLDSIKPDAVVQGQIGDCYLLAGFASLAKINPQAIRDMIQDNNDGTYTVTFPGDPHHPVTVPAPTEAELARYASGSEHGTWPAVLEKAYGIHKGGTTVPQDAAGGGNPESVAVKLLSPNGADTDDMSFTSEEELDRKLQQAIADGCPIETGINAQLAQLIGLGSGRDSETGLPTGHAYSVTGYDPATKTVTIRNPWGNTEPVGKDGKPADGVNDGVFTMKLDEFRHTFSSITYGQR